ncbi:Integrase, catalytic core [Gossypium australe]|uniref:Integrase, catalytic core n=1 Tax=Gossypium australe TaxID=47621 RepID=A0A5B6WNJ5_9ROSI|nr:Integrase, catalytic core [Gossypium australe]
MHERKGVQTPMISLEVLVSNDGISSIDSTEFKSQTTIVLLATNKKILVFEYLIVVTLISTCIVMLTGPVTIMIVEPH